jgi:hypothetical protein
MVMSDVYCTCGCALRCLHCFPISPVRPSDLLSCATILALRPLRSLTDTHASSSSAATHAWISFGCRATSTGQCVVVNVLSLVRLCVGTETETTVLLVVARYGKHGLLTMLNVTSLVLLIEMPLIMFTLTYWCYFNYTECWLYVSGAVILANPTVSWAGGLHAATLVRLRCIKNMAYRRNLCVCAPLLSLLSNCWRLQ